MFRTIKNFVPPPNASSYNPAKTVEVPANDEAEMVLQGRGADIFGFDRILPYALDMHNITVKAELNEELTLFQGVSLAVVRQLFLRKKLLAPYIIQKNNRLRFTLTNNSGAAVNVNIQLLGYDAPSLRKLLQAYKANGIKPPKPVFLYARQEIAAATSNVAVDIKTKSSDVIIRRAAIRSDADDDLTISLAVYNETVKNRIFVQQFNDEFEDGESMVPLAVGKNVPLTVYANNAHAADARTLSFLAEAYVNA